MVKTGLVIGSAHLDILARPSAESDHKDRIGSVTIEAGGTACNLAFNLRRLGRPVRLLTAWGASPIERLMGGHIEDKGVDLLADEIEGMPLAAFVAQLTVQGDMHTAVSATPVDTHTFQEPRIREAMNGIGYVIVEANLNAASLRSIITIAKEAAVPVFALAVSQDKVARLADVLPCVGAVFMNGAESERLMEVMQAIDPADLAKATGTTLVVTRGERGAVVYLPGETRLKIPAPPLEHVDTLLGVGDAFSMGIIDGVVQDGMPFEVAAQRAHGLIREIAQQTACNAFSMNALNNIVSALYETARNDQLTRLMRRSAFEVEYTRFEAGWGHTLIMVDCDHFKRVNDLLGHHTGDLVLQRVAAVLESSVRASDMPCRWGGDEFVILLPHTSAEDSVQVAERVRGRARGAELYGVTLSMGIATSLPGDTLASLMKRADAAMYRAKQAGRDSFQIAGKVEAI
ncbi:GGDEF domain-containing protein [Paraburkholderia fungorum]|uniref:GGDEF domain-containing protein n=1 Tax=Paraburkholderia fungorum TaxID=134537 RepID=UPI00069882F8|nr:PfkB family carbohydrate kinase [Paraburkholderia fungorum]